MRVGSSSDSVTVATSLSRMPWPSSLARNTRLPASAAPRNSPAMRTWRWPSGVSRSPPGALTFQRSSAAAISPTEMRCARSLCGSTVTRISALRSPWICTLATPSTSSRSSRIESPRRLSSRSVRGAATAMRSTGNTAPSISVTIGSCGRSCGILARSTASWVSLASRSRLLAYGSSSREMRPEPGKATEVILSMPLSALSSCSIGVMISRSTSSGVAPG